MKEFEKIKKLKEEINKLHTQIENKNKELLNLWFIEVEYVIESYAKLYWISVEALKKPWRWQSKIYFNTKRQIVRTLRDKGYTLDKIAELLWYKNHWSILNLLNKNWWK